MITHKDGGVVKHLSPDAITRVMNAIRRETGTDLEIARNDSTHVMEVEVPGICRRAKLQVGWTMDQNHNGMEAVGRTLQTQRSSMQAVAGRH